MVFILFSNVVIIVTSSVSWTDKDGSILQLDAAPSCQLSLALRDEHHCYCSAISTCGKWLAYSDQKSSRLFQISHMVRVVSLVWYF